jgi:hypothetical protein
MGKGELSTVICETTMAERRVGKNFGVAEAQILIWNKGLGYGL